MCEITIYLNNKAEENKLIEDVFAYGLDIKGRKLTAYKLFNIPKEFKFEQIDEVTWLESDDTLIIKGKLEDIIESKKTWIL